MTWFRIKSFISFLFTSTNQYGIHPPFLYQFVTRCLYAKTPQTGLKAIKKARQHIFVSKKTIRVKDFGAGSQRFSKEEREVSKIAIKAGMPLHQSRLILKITDYFDIKTALELGTSVGLGSLAMACKRPSIQIDTVEACQNTSNTAKQNFLDLGFKNISVHHKDFQTYLYEIPEKKSYDLIYIDGHHQKEATLSYFKKLKQHVHQNSVIILDDIYWSEGMQEAWKSICKDKDVKLSLDLYFWGIVFFKPELTKQHFRIRCFK
jgi:predicted O-methyltransferase YrrM